MNICVASKKKHAPMWRKLKDDGHNIISTWIDNIGRTKEQFKVLSQVCLNEAADSDLMIIYCEEGENIKGVFFEAGAALLMGVKVRVVLNGNCNMRHIFVFHPNWELFDNINDALTRGINE